MSLSAVQLAGTFPGIPCRCTRFIMQDHQAALPLLMLYLGHPSLAATGYYLKLTAEAFPDLQERIDRLYGDIIPDLKVRLDYEDD